MIYQESVWNWISYDRWLSLTGDEHREVALFVMVYWGTILLIALGPYCLYICSSWNKGVHARTCELQGASSGRPVLEASVGWLLARLTSFGRLVGFLCEIQASWELRTRVSLGFLVGVYDTWFPSMFVIHLRALVSRIPCSVLGSYQITLDWAIVCIWGFWIPTWGIAFPNKQIFGTVLCFSLF